MNYKKKSLIVYNLKKDRSSSEIIDYQFIQVNQLIIFFIIANAIKRF